VEVGDPIAPQVHDTGNRGCVDSGAAPNLFVVSDAYELTAIKQKQMEQVMTDNVGARAAEESPWRTGRLALLE
jgi:hypothetical protein